MRSTTFCLLLLLLSFPGHAIIRRHDREAERYIALASRYPAVCTIDDEVGCALIGSRWVLGAAHSVEDYLNPLGAPYVLFDGGRRVPVDKIILHPRRVRGAVDSDFDLALLRLAQDVAGIQPLLLYAEPDEADQLVILAGRGQTGTGLGDTAKERPAVAWAAQNRIEGAFEHSLVVTFNAPPRGEELEGMHGRGDSGAPAILEREGKQYVAGIGSWGAGGPGYESIGAFARISAHRRWIESTIVSDPPSDIPMFGSYRETTDLASLPATPAGRALKALLIAFNTSDVDEMAGFYARHSKPKSAAGAKQEAETWRELMDTYGRYELRGFREAGPDAVIGFVFATATNGFRGIALFTSPDGERLLSKITMGDLPRLPRAAESGGKPPHS